MVIVKSPSDVPVGHHYQIWIFETRTIQHEGDERSRTHPGHGYPAHSETITSTKIMVFGSEDDFKNELASLYRKDPHRKDVVALEVNKKIGVSLDIKIG